MSWAFLTFLVSLLTLAYNWWKNRAKSAAPLNPREQRMWNRILGLGVAIKAYATEHGCVAEPPVDGVTDEEHSLMQTAMVGSEVEGWNPMDRIYAAIGGKIGARVRNLVPTFPGTPDEQDAFWTDQVKEVANS